MLKLVAVTCGLLMARQTVMAAGLKLCSVCTYGTMHTGTCDLSLW